ncbi:hypothetical protein [Nitratifractor sp.]|uniref:hypothetical protein n=1 Tax=Nitratifractor sp. TaxID=2268144 RepID=UPI0025D6E732|nr:hypothetical protein [Nitratifractor sp.]
MKKILLALCAVWSLQAADHDLYNHSVEAVGSYSFNDDDMYLKDNWGWGLRYNYNMPTENFWEVGAIQFAFDYQFNEDYVGGGDSSVYRWGLNALWYADNASEMTPYALLGVGAQFFSHNEHGADDGVFAAVGGGLEYQLRGDFALVGEAKYLYGGDESALVTSVGIKYSFGQ